MDCGADVAVALSYASLLNTRTACLDEGLELWYGAQRALFSLRLLLALLRVVRFSEEFPSILVVTGLKTPVMYGILLLICVFIDSQEH